MKSKTQLQPDSFIPLRPADFIGGAHDVARVLAAKAKAVRDQREAVLKIVLTGQPGIGKTRLAEFMAAQLTGQKVIKGQSFNVESVNGRNVDFVLLRRWQEQARFVPTNWTVKIINEVDSCSLDKQDLLLTTIDELAARNAIICTSNLKLAEMDERFQTRLQQFHVKPPESSAIAQLLSRFGLRPKNVNEITVGCGGNVRAALLDAQSILDAQLV